MSGKEEQAIFDLSIALKNIILEVYNDEIQQAIKQGRKQLAEEIINYLHFKMSGKLPSKVRLRLEEKLQKELK